MTRRLHEMLTVRVGAIGVSAEGIGIVPVSLDLDGMDDTAIGQALAAGFRTAHTQAVKEFGPKLSEAWSSTPERIAEGDEPNPSDSGGDASTV